jgi:putative membrane protein
VATVIALFFHIIGIVGILIFENKFIIKCTPVNLLLSFLLLVWTQEKKNKYFYFFIVICFVTGMLAEIIGVNTGMLFGDYSYGQVLGLKLFEVPLIIGVNWFIIIYCCGSGIHYILNELTGKLTDQSKTPAKSLKALSVIIDGASLAVAFDWLMEPVAIRLGFWKWNGNGSIPLYNYVCWFFISLLLLIVFHFWNFNKQSKFSVNLLLIQSMFFLLLRTF